MHISSSVFLLLAMAGIVNSKVIHTGIKETSEVHEENNQPGRNEIRKAVCDFQSPKENINVTGKVLIEQYGPIEPLTFVGTLTVTAKEAVGEKHGFTIHQFGVPNGNCDTEAGPHYNPFGKEHGGPEDEERHVGDLGNIVFVEAPSTYGALKEYTSNIEVTDSIATLYGDYSVGGRSICIHEDEDDLGKDGHPDSKITGHSGESIACCNINMIVLKNKEERLGC